MALVKTCKKPPMSIMSVSGDVCSFNSLQEGLPLKSHVVQLTATQSGSGTPSPSNPRPISGWNGQNIYHSGADTSNPTVYYVAFGSTIYGGQRDARTGVLTVTHLGVDLGALTWTKESNHFYSNVLSDAKYPPNNSNVAEIMCETYQVIFEANVVSEAFDYSIGMSRTGRIYIYDSSLSSGDATAFTTAVTGIKLVYKLATPTTIQLPPCPIETLLGENNIWADTGATSLQYIKIGR